ncbi:MAG: hypothetical protein JST04_01895 [Bdellovibrionales bacterium]|nr:hypothetical protein [Bdellovibrionales bacterium]
MGRPDSGKRESNPPKGAFPHGKVTAAHLAGLRPRPAPESPIGAWDSSTAFIAGVSLAFLGYPELSALNVAAKTGMPYSAFELLVLLGVIALFGVFPLVFLQHCFLQHLFPKLSGRSPTRAVRLASAGVALAVMLFSTEAMKPMVGYDQKVAANRAAHPRIAGESNRMPAAAPVESIRDGTTLYR